MTPRDIHLCHLEGGTRHVGGTGQHHDHLQGRGTLRGTEETTVVDLDQGLPVEGIITADHQGIDLNMLVSKVSFSLNYFGFLDISRLLIMLLYFKLLFFQLHISYHLKWD